MNHYHYYWLLRYMEISGLFKSGVEGQKHLKQLFETGSLGWP
jgi:hypothetical protein